MQTLTISLPGSTPRSYPITVGEGTIDRLAELLPRRYHSKGSWHCVVLTDSNIDPLWGETVAKALGGVKRIVIAPGEPEKRIETLSAVWQRFLDHGLDRHGLVVNLGGGVIGDLGGFAAATFMRGVDFIQLPTTLLSQVDASVGGKTGIDFGGIKNSIGVFAQPQGVVIDVATLQTLPARERAAGCAEMIKHGVIASRIHFDRLAEGAFQHWQPARAVELIAESVSIKAAVVASDEREAGPRKILNFGHTIAHAIEAASLCSPAPLLHGEAVALGMLAEGRIAQQRGMLSDSDLREIEQLIALHALPRLAPRRYEPQMLAASMKHDKKNRDGELLFALPRGIGTAVFDISVPEAEALAAIESVMPR